MALIKTSNSVPSVYTQRSRDFQTIGHLYEAVFNSSKVAADMVDHMAPGGDFDERLLELSSVTRGFLTKHEYSAKDLAAVVESLGFLLRIKGTKRALDSAICILLRAQSISDPYTWRTEGSSIDAQKKYFNLGLSERVTDRALLFDLFEYLLPFGFTYRVTNYSAPRRGENVTRIAHWDKVHPTTSSRSDDLKQSAIVSNRTTTTILEPTEMLADVAPVSPRPVSDGVIEVQSSEEVTDD